MMGETKGTPGSSGCGTMSGDGGVSRVPGNGMMDGSWGQAAGSGMFGWAIGGFALIVILIVIWIIVGILLIASLYRKLTTKLP